MQENQDPPPAFLQNPILAQLKLQRCINRFRILHGRLVSCFRDGLTFGGGGAGQVSNDIPNATAYGGTINTNRYNVWAAGVLVGYHVLQVIHG